MADAYQVSIDTRQLRVLLERTSGPFQDTGPVAEAMQEALRKWAALVQWRAVRNVSGYPVVYEGGAFVVRVRTGTLKGSIEMQYPYEHALQARVFVNGAITNPGDQPGRGAARLTPVSKYAFRIEFGGPPIDLKKTMQGKVVPFFASRTEKARGPFSARGLTPVDAAQQGFGSRWRSEHLDRKLQAQGKSPMTFEKKGGNAAYEGAKRSASTYFISFRTVGKTGWVIPEAKPRPFMRAALMSTRDEGRRMAVRTIVDALDITKRGA